jgi:hypothetical protein
MKPEVVDSKFHRYLIDGQDLRNLGDYEVGPAVTEPQAREALVRAAEFIAAAVAQLPG